VETIRVAQRVKVTDYISTTNTTQLNKREHKMKLKLSDVQMEQITVTYLDQMHHDLKEELIANDMDPYLDADEVVDITRSIIAIEVIMRDLMYADYYYQWKLESGVEL